MEPIEIASLGLGIASIILGTLTAIQNIRNSLGEQEPWKQRAARCSENHLARATGHRKDMFRPKKNAR